MTGAVEHEPPVFRFRPVADGAAGESPSGAFFRLPSGQASGEQLSEGLYGMYETFGAGGVDDARPAFSLYPVFFRREAAVQKEDEPFRAASRDTGVYAHG